MKSDMATVGEVARLMGISKATVIHLCELHKVQGENGEYLIPFATVEAWLSQYGSLTDPVVRKRLLKQRARRTPLEKLLLFAISALVILVMVLLYLALTPL